MIGIEKTDRERSELLFIKKKLDLDLDLDIFEKKKTQKQHSPEEALQPPRRRLPVEQRPLPSRIGPPERLELDQGGRRRERSRKSCRRLSHHRRRSRRYLLRRLRRRRELLVEAVHLRDQK